MGRDLRTGGLPRAQGDRQLPGAEGRRGIPRRAAHDRRDRSQSRSVSRRQDDRAPAGSASSSRKSPILLRVDFDAGHGIGSTRAQQDREAADTYAFLLWQTGVKGYQPA